MRNGIGALKEVMKAFADGGLNFLGLKILLFLAGHSQGAGFDAFHRFLRVTVNPEDKVWNHGCTVHARYLLQSQFTHDALVNQRRVNVPVRYDHGTVFKMRPDESVGVIQAVCCEQTGFFQRRLVAQFHRGKGQLSKFTVATWFVGHDDFREWKFTQQFAKDASRLAFP